MKKLITALATILLTGFASAQPTAKSDYFEQSVAASDPLRVEQASELDAYIQAMKQDPAALRALLQPDYRATTINNSPLATVISPHDLGLKTN